MAVVSAAVCAPLTRRATAVYRSATPAQIEAGSRWYSDAHAIVRDQSVEHHVTVEVASGVIAALSPRTGWGPNVVLAERMLASGGTLDHGALGRSLRQARAICEGVPALTVLRGPKTRAFYSAIVSAGESTDAVIDRHAWDMLVGKRGATPPNITQYRAAAHCMSQAARITGQSVHHVQAVTWLAWRSRFWSRDAFGYQPQTTLDFSALEALA